MNRKNKYLTILAVLLLLSSSAFAAIMSTAEAHSPPLTFPTYAFLSATPNPVGVGQTVYITMFLDRFPPTAGGAGGDRWHGYMLNIVKPDGTNDTAGPFDADPIASATYGYVPQTPGTYTFQWYWPGQVLQAGVNPNPAGLPYVNDTFQGSMSRPLKVTVQQQPVQMGAADTPLPSPTTYWNRPININNRLWATTLGSNWLMAGYNNTARFNPYGSAPRTAHIVWTKNYDTKFGGAVGGELGELGYYGGATYEMPFNPPLIMNGVIYYNAYPNVGSGGVINSGYYAVDLRTGETLYFSNGTGNGQSVTTILQGFGNSVSTFNPGYPSLQIAQPLYMGTPNQWGAIPYLWSIGGINNATGTMRGNGTIGTSGSGNTIRYDMYDATNGKWILSFTNAQTGTPVLDANNNLLVYIINYGAGWLAMWNSTKAIGFPANQGTDQWQWRPPTGAVLDWNRGIQWNVTIDKSGIPSTAGVTPTPNLAINKIGGNVLVTSMLIAGNTSYNFVHVGFDATTGQRLWIQQHQVDSDKYSIQAMGSGVYVMWAPEELAWYGYNATTGEQMWGPSPIGSNDWAYYGLQPQAAYGMLYGSGYDGTLQAWNITTGQKVWSTFEGANNEVPYGQVPLNGGGGQNSLCIAGGIVYAENGEHSPNQPLYRGEKLWAFDAFTGKVLWNITNWAANDAVADGYLVAINAYTNQIDCFGRGQTSTTVSAPETAIPQGQPVVIKGTITDQSPGAKGTPAIADENMSAWMEHIYNQQPAPANVHGVPVQLSATDVNGKNYDLGTVTSDSLGNYAAMWTPPTQGLYTIVATFAGSDSYWSSYGSTVVGVGLVASGSTASPAPSTTSPPVAPQPGTEQITMTYIAIAAVAVIAIVIAAALVLRRRK